MRVQISQPVFSIIPVEAKAVDAHDCESWLVSSNLTNRIFSKKSLTYFENDDIISLSLDGGIGRHTGFKRLRPLT